MRLIGLDIARFLAFVGMVLVNFRIASEATETGWSTPITNALEGRAAALFVVLAGVGFGLAYQRGRLPWHLTLKRAAFLFGLGMINMLIFDADILHFYGLYFIVAACFAPLSDRALIWGGVTITLLAGLAILIGPFERAWDFDTYHYADFWTLNGFLRHSFYNGWHPVFPWVSFMLFGMWIARLDLTKASVQNQLLFGGMGVTLLTLLISRGMIALDPEFEEILSLSPVPALPLYMLAGCGSAAFMIGGLLRLSPWLERRTLAKISAKAGQQTLTLYVAHILIGLGTLEALGLLSGQLNQTEIFAISLLFCAGSALYAWGYSKVFKRGPLEAAMRFMTEGKL
ncbi:MAG: DUF418 domain-containing protein [Halocynthiibacter sp.]